MRNFAGAGIMVVVFTGCSMSGGVPQVRPALANVDGDIVAAKVPISGDGIAVKAPVLAVADTAIQGAVGAYNTASKTSTDAGRDITNDSAVMKEYLSTVKALNERQIKLMLQIILAMAGALTLVCGVFAGFVTTLIGGLLWALKLSMTESVDDGNFKEKLIERRTKQEAV